MPFISRWPGHIQPGVSGELICHVDILASMAALTGQSLPEAAGPDSFNVLPALLGEKHEPPCRDHLVEQGSVLALRKGPWKLVPPGAGGGRKKANRPPNPQPELFDLTTDLSETTNVAGQHPDIVADMTALLKRVQEQGRSRP